MFVPFSRRRKIGMPVTGTAVRFGLWRDWPYRPPSKPPLALRTGAAIEHWCRTSVHSSLLQNPPGWPRPSDCAALSVGAGAVARQRVWTTITAPQPISHITTLVKPHFRGREKNLTTFPVRGYSRERENPTTQVIPACIYSFAAYDPKASVKYLFVL